MNYTRKDTAVTPELEKEIQKHHRSLKQFIDVSYDSTAPVRKNSRRATKAREKLLKLSQAQFIELSTDVYDELHRRINESKEEPDHLLPKETFHPKRNQAREKLASLPAQRFKDLVNDILYEIERRYSNVPQSPDQESELGKTDGNGRVGSTDSALQASQHGVQSKTVIPTKTQMAWSSDEEDNGVEQDERHPSFGSRPLEPNNGDLFNSSLERNENKFHNGTLGTSEEGYREAADVVPEMISMKSPSSNKHTSNSSIKRGLSINKDREILMLLEEGTKMDGKITDLEKQLEYERQRAVDLENEKKTLTEQNQQARESHEAEIRLLNRQIDEAPNKNQHVLLQSQYDALQSSHDIITDKHSILISDFEQLKRENEDLKLRHTSLQNSKELIPDSNGSNDLVLQQIQEQLYQLAQVETNDSNVKSSGELRAQSDGESWKKRFEQARSDHFYNNLNKADISDASFQEYVSDSGLISMRKLADFQASIESFYLEFNRKEHDKNELFKSVSTIATKADLICNEVNADNKGSSIVKSCVTHSIVVARHYLTFQNILPSIVLNIAVNDVALAICDLVKSVKLSSSNDEKGLSIKKPQQSTPVIQELHAPSAFSSANDTSSPVRPLKMIERLNSPAIGGISRFSESEKTSTAGIDSLQEKRLALATSQLAPITTQVVSNPENQDRTESPRSTQAPLVSPRGPGIISLAGKYRGLVGGDRDLELTPKTSPTSKNILERVKIFESPESEAVISKKSVPQISNSSTDGFAKFGARRRSSVGDAASLINNGAAQTINNGHPSVLDNESKVNESSSLSKDHTVTSGSRLANNEDAIENNNEQTLQSNPETGKSSRINTNVDLNEIPSAQHTIRTENGSAHVTPDSHLKNLQSKQSTTTNEAIAEMEQDKATVAANFNVEDFNILNPDNTLHELLLYLEHQTMDVISTIQTLLASIKRQDSTRGILRDSAKAINIVVGQMTEATNISMSQTRNVQLREHGSWVVQNLEDCGRRMEILCGANNKTSDDDYADKNFKQRLAGVAFDIAKSTKELVKSVEELSLKQEIALLDARLSS